MGTRTTALRRLRAAPPPTRPDSTTTKNPTRSTDMKMYEGLHLIHEALSRARMPRPQEIRSEAAHRRPAREIAMRVRREQTRLLGS
jgi:hypothetical protein